MSVMDFLKSKYYHVYITERQTGNPSAVVVFERDLKKSPGCSIFIIVEPAARIVMILLA